MSKRSVSRRQFLLGSSVVGTAAMAAGVAGIAQAEQLDVALDLYGGGSQDGKDATGEHEIFTIESKCMTPGKGTWSWDAVPEDIPADQIAETVDTDVVVIGAGLAGCCAAIAAAEEGAKVVLIEKTEEGTICGRGLDIAAFHTRKQAELVEAGLMEEPDYRHVIRRWIYWAQGRVKEPLLWEWSRKSGACFDWLEDLVSEKGLSTYIWDGYYKGPDYTEYPVTHAFYLTGTEDATFNFQFYGSDDTFGNAVLMPRLYETVTEKGAALNWSEKCVRLLRDGDGPVSGIVVECADGTYKQYNAKSVVIASGDYSSNKEMVQCYAPFQNYSTDLYCYLPPNCNMGELHQQAMWIGGAMQKSEPHASVTHLDFGAASYGFLHVNGLGQRFKNEDVNTQSKSIVKAFQPTKQAYTIYDAGGLEEVKRQVDAGIGGGLQWGQLTQAIGYEYNLDAQKATLEGELESGLTFQADTIEELAEQIGCDPEVLKATVDRYNEMCDNGDDVDFGKRAEILYPVKNPPFYAGHLQACLLTMCGGLRTDLQCHVLDIDDRPIDGLYVCGSAAGDFFGAGDYPTFVAGIGHGRCVTFGRMAGIYAAGGDAHEEIPSIEI